MESLSKIFGTEARVKIMRLFLLNKEQGFEVKEIAKRVRVSPASVRKEINILKNARFLSKHSFSKIEINRYDKKIKKKVSGFILNKNFPYLVKMENLLIDTEFLKNGDLAKRFKPVGKIKLFIVSGVFTQNEDSRADMLLVVDNIKRRNFDNIIRSLESEIGKELSYAVFDTQEFIYRMNMYDKLVRDIIDFPHKKIIDNAGLTELTKKVS